jgi:NitT/TauT family transport system permease protein
MSSLAARWFGMPHSVRIGLIFVAALLLWEFAVAIFRPPEFVLPAPSSVFERITKMPVFYLIHTWRTFYETVLGFGVAVIAGVLMAVMIVSSRFLEETLYVLLLIINGVPKVAVAPLFVIWLGTGIEPKIAIATFITLFVIVINVVLGLRSVDPDMLSLARALKGSPFKTLIKIRVPNALPNMFVAMKLGITTALIGTIVAEFVASDRGLGYVILVATGAFDTVQVFASITILSVMGMVLFFILDFAERLVLPWHISMRAEPAKQLAA